MKDNESLWVNDTLVPLSPLQLRLLSYFCSHPQQVLTKERIIESVWGHREVSDVSLARAFMACAAASPPAARPVS